MWDLRMNDSLDSLVNNLKCNLYNTKCKHCMKCKACKKCEKCKDSFSEWCEMCKACKKLSGFCKECNKICKYCKCCLDKYEEIISIPSEYHISKVLD